MLTALSLPVLTIQSDDLALKLDGFAPICVGVSILKRNIDACRIKHYASC